MAVMLVKIIGRRGGGMDNAPTIENHFLHPVKIGLNTTKASSSLTSILFAIQGFDGNLRE